MKFVQVRKRCFPRLGYAFRLRRNKLLQLIYLGFLFCSKPHTYSARNFVIIQEIPEQNIKLTVPGKPFSKLSNETSPSFLGRLAISVDGQCVAIFDKIV